MMEPKYLPWFVREVATSWWKWAIMGKQLKMDLPVECFEIGSLQLTISVTNPYYCDVTILSPNLPMTDDLITAFTNVGYECVCADAGEVIAFRKAHYFMIARNFRYEPDPKPRRRAQR